MRKLIVGLMVCAMVMVSLPTAHAALTSLGLDDGASYRLLNGNLVIITPPHRQLIEDSATAVIWYDFTRGSLSYAGALNFAGTLEVDFDGSTKDAWRLPTEDEFISMATSSPESVFANVLDKGYWLLDSGEIYDFKNKRTLTAGPYCYNAMAVTAVPIPGAAWLLGAGLLGIIGFRKRNQ